MATAPSRPAEPPALPAYLLERTGFLLSVMGFTARRRFHEALAPLGLGGPKHFLVLNALDHEGGASQQALGQNLLIDPSTMVSVIDDFERDGLAERRRNPEDRRAHAIYVTRKGKGVLARARRAAAEVEADLLEPLDPDECAMLRDLLARVAVAKAVLPPGLGDECPPGGSQPGERRPPG